MTQTLNSSEDTQEPHFLLPRPQIMEVSLAMSISCKSEMIHLWIPPPYSTNEEFEDEGNCNLLGITWQINGNTQAFGSEYHFDNSCLQFSSTSPFLSFLAEGSCKEYSIIYQPIVSIWILKP